MACVFLSRASSRLPKRPSALAGATGEAAGEGPSIAPSPVNPTTAGREGGQQVWEGGQRLVEQYVSAGSAVDDGTNLLWPQGWRLELGQ